VNLSGDYTLPASPFGKVTFHADGSYRSSQTSNINPGYFYFVIPSAFIGNVRASLSSKENLTYSLFVRNVTNNPDISGGINDQEFGNPYRLRNVGTPRTFGLGVRYRF
jgi:outer membrane receptor protein involved in Fe transport